MCLLLWFNKVVNLLRTWLPWQHLHLECRISPACHRAFKTGGKCAALGRRVSPIALQRFPGSLQREADWERSIKDLLFLQHGGPGELNYRRERDEMNVDREAHLSLMGTEEQTERQRGRKKCWLGSERLLPLVILGGKLFLKNESSLFSLLIWNF